MRILLSLLLLSVTIGTTQAKYEILDATIAIGDLIKPEDGAAFAVQSTTATSLPCPKMTEAQRDLIAVVPTGACVFNLDVAATQFWSGTLWISVGVPPYILEWVTATPYVPGSFVYTTPDYKLWIANTAHTSGATFIGDIANWDEASDDMDTIGASTDNAVMRWDGTSGGIPQDSTTLIDDAGNMSIDGALSINGLASQIGLGNSTYFGFDAGSSDDLTSNLNTGFGFEALRRTTTGINNVAIGDQAFENNLTGNYNTIVGSRALQSGATAGTNNTAIGNYASRLVTGIENTTLGAEALENSLNSSRSVAIGFKAGTRAIGADNVFIGTNAQGSESGGGMNRNIVIGSQSGSDSRASDDNILIGYDLELPTNITSDYMSINDLIYGDLANNFIGINNAAPDDALDVTGRLEVTSTTEGSTPCPVMTEAQRDAITGHIAGDCIYNSDTNKLNNYDGSSWTAIGGSSTFQDVYGLSSQPQLTLDTTGDALRILDNSTPLAAPLFEVLSNDTVTKYLEVAAAGNTSVSLDVNGRLETISTTEPSLPCPVMTEAQRDLTTPTDGDCVFNSDTILLNNYNGTAWVAVGAASTLQDAYGNSTQPQFTLDTTGDALRIVDNSTPIAAPLFEVMDNGALVDYFSVSASQVLIENRLQVDSTTLPSRPMPTMTTVQRDLLSPAAGDMIYNNTTNYINTYNGAAWIEVSSSGIPTMAKGALFASNGIANGEFDPCADGEILEWDAAEAAGFKCVTKPLTSIALTKGQIITNNGSSDVAQPACANGQILEYDSAESDGLKCVANGSGGAPYSQFSTSFSDTGVGIGTAVLASVNVTTTKANAIILISTVNQSASIYKGVYSTNAGANASLRLKWNGTAISNDLVLALQTQSYPTTYFIEATPGTYTLALEVQQQGGTGTAYTSTLKATVIE